MNTLKCCTCGATITTVSPSMQDCCKWECVECSNRHKKTDEKRKLIDFGRLGV